tara:strand:- start:19319 stop:20527 length:1209 start_codon:yes stop_codon:yes gene_type:complete
MSFKRFKAQDVINNVIVAKPEINFIVHSGSVFYKRERLISGSFSSEKPLVNHIDNGHLSLLGLNVDRPQESLIYSFIEKDSTRFAHKTVSTSNFDDRNQFRYGEVLKQNYPLSASLSRIIIPEGQEFDTNVGTDSEQLAHNNKKYIRALRNPINMDIRIGPNNEYGALGTKAVNLICIPGIFYGSSVDRGSIELNYYLTGTLVATAKDLYSDGRLIQTKGPTTGQQVGIAIYNQGILVLTGSESLHSNHVGKFLSPASNSSPSWLNFGTGIPQVGTYTAHGTEPSSSYSVQCKGINKIPTITMFAYAKEGEFNFSHNPTFLSMSSGDDYTQNQSFYIETKKKIRKINKSDYTNYHEPFENHTYISKVGIYDENKNLIAIASLANPIKKTEKREFMIKMKLDF